MAATRRKFDEDLKIGAVHIVRESACAAVLNRVQGSGGVWRTPDGRSLYLHRSAAAAVAERGPVSIWRPVCGCWRWCARTAKHRRSERCRRRRTSCSQPGIERSPRRPPN